MIKKQISNSSLQDKHVLRLSITGLVGTGKSTYTMNLAKKHKRLIVWDATGDYSKKLGFKLFNSLSDLKEAVRKDYRKGFQFAFNPVTSLDDISVNEVNELNMLCKMMLKIQESYNEGLSNTQIAFVLEEASSICNSELNLDKDAPYLRFFIKKGRHFGINFYCVDQSLTEITKAVVKGLKEHCLFKQPDIHYPFMCSLLRSKKYAEIAVDQPNFHYVYKKDSEFRQGKTKR